ncbi:stage III sporulation protein AC [Ammoniphilus sp. 3BR4]|uniref:stage III sporulation protein AC n=1 Tax=Ammoniphilus sp. 3BR4 TaxID=3158265 RepID=UPI003465D9E2
MPYDINDIFQIAGIGIVVAMIHTILKQAGKGDWADWITLVGVVVVLYMVATYVHDLFQEIKRVFLFK